MPDLQQRRATLETELDDLREQLVVADEAYENAATATVHEATDKECQRLRKRLRALRLELRNLTVERPAPSTVRAKAQGAGK